MNRGLFIYYTIVPRLLALAFFGVLVFFVNPAYAITPDELSKLNEKISQVKSVDPELASEMERELQKAIISGEIRIEGLDYIRDEKGGAGLSADLRHEKDLENMRRTERSGAILENGRNDDVKAVDERGSAFDGQDEAQSQDDKAENVEPYEYGEIDEPDEPVEWEEADKPDVYEEPQEIEKSEGFEEREEPEEPEERDQFEKQEDAEERDRIEEHEKPEKHEHEHEEKDDEEHEEDER